MTLMNTNEDNAINHKNYNFLACDWFKNVLFSTNSLAKLLSDSLLLDSLLLDSLLSDSLISQSHSKIRAPDGIEIFNFESQYPIWGSDFFRVLQTFNLSCVCCFIFNTFKDVV